MIRVFPKAGGDKIVFEVGDKVRFRNIFHPDYFAYGNEMSLDGKVSSPVVISSFLSNSEEFEIKQVLAPDPRKIDSINLHGIYRYIIEAKNKNGETREFLINEIYLYGSSLV